ncbi:MAG: hypothetical protein JNK31_05760 [Candidatus Competibacter sp.]|nr:hypothetical protein [Candidatus Competibacter sp.]
MEINAIAKIAGVLGFFISVATFILTRIERRKNVVVEVYKGDYSEFYKAERGELFDDDELIKIRLTNVGGVPVIVNPESFFIKGLGKEILIHHTEWVGVKEIPSPLAAGTSVEVAVFRSEFEKLLSLKSLDKYANTEEYEKTVVPLEVGFKDHKGKVFTSKSFSYFYYVGEIERSA